MFLVCSSKNAYHIFITKLNILILQEYNQCAFSECTKCIQTVDVHNTHFTYHKPNDSPKYNGASDYESYDQTIIHLHLHDIVMYCTSHADCNRK